MTAHVGSSRRAVVCAAALVVRAQSGAVLPGDALPGVTPAELEEFRLGVDDFLEVETSEEGLGPAFNGTSCAACHNVPAIGGISTVSEVRAGHRRADGTFQPASRGRRNALPSFLDPHAHMPADDSTPRRTSSRAACRCRCSAPG